MDRSQLINFAILAAVIVAFLLWKRAGQIDSAEAHRLVQEGAKLVDVRSPGEFAAGHIAGAVNIPVGDLRARADSLGAKDRPVVLYCASGSRSAMARSTLMGLGFTQVYNLGGMSRW
jgi:phage shock protein E